MKGWVDGKSHNRTERKHLDATVTISVWKLKLRADLSRLSRTSDSPSSAGSSLNFSWGLLRETSPEVAAAAAAAVASSSAGQSAPTMSTPTLNWEEKQRASEAPPSSSAFPIAVATGNLTYFIYSIILLNKKKKNILRNTYSLAQASGKMHETARVKVSLPVTDSSVVLRTKKFPNCNSQV